MCDINGVISRDKDFSDNKYMAELAEITNPHNVTGMLKDAMVGADVFIGGFRSKHSFKRYGKNNE